LQALCISPQKQFRLIILSESLISVGKIHHSFCRYADDVNIYVGSERAGKRVMNSLIRYVEGPLKLKVNLEKSAVARPWKRSFLGFSFLKIWGKMRISVPEKS